MVKIKRKVEMTKKELVQFLIENTEITEITQGTKNGKVFEQCIKIKSDNKLKRINNNLVEVEIEEEITEETKFPEFLEISFDRKSGRDFAVVRENQSIKNIVDKNVEHFIDTRTIHLFDDDGTHTLIWKYGELVGDE